MSRSGRPSVRIVDHAHGVRIVDNPAWPKIRPAGIEVACHDGTPCVDFECAACGAMNHAHASQIAGAPDWIDEVGLSCPACRHSMIVSLSALRRGFAESAAALKPTGA